MFVNSNRIRSIVSECMTEADIMSALRYHKIRYTFSTETGFLNIRIPYRKGCIRIYRTCSKRSPFMVQTIKSVIPHIPVDYDN